MKVTLAVSPVLSLEHRNLDFGGRVTAGAVDDILLEGLAAQGDSQRHLSFDFSKNTFVEASALQMIVAACLWLKRQGDDFSIRIPRSQKVRDFWRAWGFPQAITEALNLEAFSAIVPITDRHYFGETIRYYRPVELPGHPGFAGDSIRSRNFFGFYTMPISRRVPSIRLAYEEKDHWNVSHIRAVITDKLGRDSSYFPSRVVFEAVLNALRHPEATVLQTAATDQKTKEGRLFTVHFWDDGISMAETLHRAIRGNVPVRGSFEQDLDRRYLVVQSDENTGLRCERVESAEMLLEGGIERHDALFATIMPAVSSDLFGLDHAVAEEVTAEDIRFGRRGMGLFVLVNAVVEILGGSVAFRTSDHFMNVRRTNQLEHKASGGASLRVRLKRRASALPEFVGNLLTIRVPYQPSA